MKDDKHIILLIAGIIILFGWVTYKENVNREDTRTHIEEEVVLNDIPIKVSIAYENEELIIKPSPEDKYQCLVNYEIEIDNNKFHDNFSLISDENPIDIKDIYINKYYEDNNVKVYLLVVKFYENGNPQNEAIVYDVNFYGYLKEIKQYFDFKDWYAEFAKKMEKSGYIEYDEQKMDEILVESREKWLDEINFLYQE